VARACSSENLAQLGHRDEPHDLRLLHRARELALIEAAGEVEQGARRAGDAHAEASRDVAFLQRHPLRPDTGVRPRGARMDDVDRAFTGGRISHSAAAEWSLNAARGPQASSAAMARACADSTGPSR
jgi:hypothetical protein